ncbi:Sugar-specific transcriptional regulator TrmB [Amycolatopsis arida]|uniref:Sugar-specific transcriptional regulator TrmB n=1 Tax=Amycolatopsis arida TaxID=587909 RepID=A0A1I5SQT9_9PSEU|nr:helix-turn-helix domain-containing protein [Amycolatopsis arida]TDX96385.1 sugar-specific transcriptional regulator TrmB [Amycolatopsis arida]SFP73048.1 Sugar-specific transcriptional regulator TrmB [Amycolatopsis arida]
MPDLDTTAERLVELGFSRYEARAYLGLLGGEPMTGYALANATGIPQPKVYETLRKLLARGAVVKIGDDPARFVALPAEQLFGQLENDFRRRMADAKLELERFDPAGSREQVRLFHSTRDRGAILGRARELLGAAREHVYLSGSAAELADLKSDVEDAERRGVRFDVLHFGDAPFELARGRLVRHASTDRVLYRHHQAHHLALVADGTGALWSVAPGGADWEGLWVSDPLFAAVVKGYIRHDIYVQRIYADLPEELTERYGPGLAGLVTPAREAAEALQAPQEGTRTDRRLA